MNMIDIIKQAGIDAVGAGNPVNIIFGEVLNSDELQIKIDQKQILPKDFFIVSEGLTRYEIDIIDKKIVIREGLSQGDTVILLRVQGGQKYVILDKVV